MLVTITVSPSADPPRPLEHLLAMMILCKAIREQLGHVATIGAILFVVTTKYPFYYSVMYLSSSININENKGKSQKVYLIKLLLQYFNSFIFLH